MRRKPALLLALDQLKMEANARHELEDSSFDVCRDAPHDIRYAHALYREIGQIALDHQLWETAEEFAIRTLKKRPDSGAAIRILGKSLKGRDRLADAALCHRYRLPSSIRARHFSPDELSIIDSSESTDVSKLMAYTAACRQLTAPLMLPRHEIAELSQTELNSSAAYTFHLDKGSLWFDGFNTVAWDKSGRVIDDASRGLPEVVHDALGHHTAHRLPGRTCVLGNRNSGNYYHWMNDILPRIQVLQKSGVPLNSIRNFVINPLQHDFQFESLQRFGIGRDRLVFCDESSYFDCEQLYIPLFGSNSLGKGLAPWTPAFLKDSFGTGTRPAADRRLYVSRKHANGRSILNEESLVLCLQKRGFECVHLEGLSITEQADLFGSASVILGAHGAGFTNIVFCQPETTIIELYKDHIAPCYWLTSEVTALRHAVHYCGNDANLVPDAGADGERYHASADRRRLSDLTVDLTTLTALLDHLDIREPRA